MLGSYMLGILFLVLISDLGGFPPLEDLALAIFGVTVSVPIMVLVDLRFPCYYARIEPNFWYVLLDIYLLFCSKFETNLSWSRVLIVGARLHRHQFSVGHSAFCGLYLFCSRGLNGLLMLFWSEFLVCRSRHIHISFSYYFREIGTVLEIWQMVQVGPKAVFPA